MNIFQHLNLSKSTSFRSGAGILLILAGVVLFLDRYLNTGWLSYTILPVVGFLLVLWGMRQKNSYRILAGGVIGGVGAGVAAALNPFQNHLGLPTQAGLFIFFTGIGWLLVVVMTTLLKVKPLWWSSVPAGALVGMGYFLAFTGLRWVELIFYVGLGVGLALFVWGLAMRLIGLVIPGCLLLTTAPGIYLAWSMPDVGSPLVHTGIMLVWLSFGWAMITLSGRILGRGFIWWPLIPGGILAVIGCGLYIGGDPGNALGFITNTGSIGLMIFGLYLLLMRKGIHR